MHPHSAPTFLLAPPGPALLAAIQPLLSAALGPVEVVLSAQDALAAISAPHPPGLALIDESLPGMSIEELLTAARAQTSASRMPIVLIADTVTEAWIRRLAEGVIDDLIPRSAEPSYWLLRIDLVLRNRRLAHELEALRESAVRNAQLDCLTGVYNREALLAMLFRETDRVQRSRSDLCLVLFDIDDFGHWNSRLGADACDDLLCQVASRTGSLLRSYDLLGRPGMDEFLIALPLCTATSAMSLAERLRDAVFSTPFQVAGEAVRLSACFGIAASHGRAPVVVLREAEKALEWAKAAGPESIQCFGTSPGHATSPVTFLSSTTGDELLAW